MWINLFIFSVCFANASTPIIKSQSLSMSSFRWLQTPCIFCTDNTRTYHGLEFDCKIGSLCVFPSDIFHFLLFSLSHQYSNGARVTDTHVRKPQEWFGSEDVKRVIPRNCANTEISNKNRLVMKFSVFLPPFSFVFIYTNMDLFCFPLSLPATSAEYLAQLVFIDTCQIYMN